jgi:hypothetical protein
MSMPSAFLVAWSGQQPGGGQLVGDNGFVPWIPLIAELSSYCDRMLLPGCVVRRVSRAVSNIFEFYAFEYSDSEHVARAIV